MRYLVNTSSQGQLGGHCEDRVERPGEVPGPVPARISHVVSGPRRMSALYADDSGRKRQNRKFEAVGVLPMELLVNRPVGLMTSASRKDSVLGIPTFSVTTTSTGVIAVPSGRHADRDRPRHAKEEKVR